MVKANITLPNGTEVTIDGTPEEVQSLLSYYGGGEHSTPSTTQRKPSKKKASSKKTSAKPAPTSESLDLTEIVNLVKNCDEAEAIETQVLDRASQVDRVLLPLYVVHEHLNNAFGLTSGDIAKIVSDLGVPIALPNVSRTLSNTASKYVMGSNVRKKGAKITYKLSRRGTKYMKGVIGGSDED